MAIERIFNELHSRKFKFVIDGEVYELPHLNSMKPVIYDAYSLMDKDGNIANDRLMIFLFNNSGNMKFAQKLKTVKIKEARKLFTSWQEWSGFELGKFLGVLGAVDKYLDAIELDLLEKQLNYSVFFEMSPRTQISFIEALSKDFSSNYFTAVNEFDYRWGIVPEILSKSLEAFVAANSKEDAETYKAERPYGNPEQIEISEETQAKIMEKLTPMNWD